MPCLAALVAILQRATKIRRFFNLTKEDDVRKFVVRREVVPKKEGAKPYTKAPSIQRLVTPLRLQRRRHLQSLKKRKTAQVQEQAAEFKVLLAKRAGEQAAERKAHRQAKKAANANKRA